MNDIPQLSVIMTVYNGEKFIQETLNAIFAQTFSDFELIVVNNGCTDSTQDMLESYDDPRMRVVYQTLDKPTFGDGIRLAYANARGQLIAVNDADDVAMPDRFERQVAALQNDEKLGLVSSWFEEIDENSQFVQNCQPPNTQAELVEAYQVSNPLAHATYMYRKAVADQVGGYVDKYHYGSDFALAMEIIKTGWKVEVLPQYLMKIRVHSGQASQAAELGVMRAYEAKELFAEAATLPGLSAQSQQIAIKNNSKRILQYAFALFAEGQTAKGWRMVFAGLVHSPVYGGLYFLFRLACRFKLMKHPIYNPHHT